MAEQGVKITTLEKTLSERDRQLQELRAEVAMRDAAIRERDTAIIEKNAHISSLERMYNELESRANEEFRRVNESKVTELSQLKTANSSLQDTIRESNEHMNRMKKSIESYEDRIEKEVGCCYRCALICRDSAHPMLS